MIAEIHFQGVKDNGESFGKLLSSNKPFIASLVPAFLDKSLKNNGKEVMGRVYPEQQYYPSWFIGALKDLREKTNIIWFQEGMFHYCEPCFEQFEKNGGREKDPAPDPWHEHICVYNGKEQSLEKQLKSIKEGKELISDLTGIVPEGYCPPNHLHNEDTLTAARNLGFKYANVRNFTNLPVYEEKELLILPEAKVGERHERSSPVVYAYYGNFVENFSYYSEELLDWSQTRFQIKDKPEFKTALNQIAVRGYKKLRDWKKKSS